MASMIVLVSRSAMSVLGDDVVDPPVGLGDPGVDAGVLGPGASDAPRHDADLRARRPAREQRTAAVALKTIEYYDTASCVLVFDQFAAKLIVLGQVNLP